VPSEIVERLGQQVRALGLIPTLAERLGCSESLVEAWFSRIKRNRLPADVLDVIVEEIHSAGGVEPVVPWLTRAAMRGEDRRAQETLRFPPHEVGRGRGAA